MLSLWLGRINLMRFRAQISTRIKHMLPGPSTHTHLCMEMHTAALSLSLHLPGTSLPVCDGQGCIPTAQWLQPCPCLCIMAKPLLMPCQRAKLLPNQETADSCQGRRHPANLVQAPVRRVSWSLENCHHGLLTSSNPVSWQRLLEKETRSNCCGHKLC